MGGSKGGSYSAVPLTDRELALVDAQKASTNAMTGIAQDANTRSNETNNIWKNNYLPIELGTKDPSTGLLAATVNANDMGAMATNSFLAGNKANTDLYNQGLMANTNAYNQGIKANTNQYSSNLNGALSDFKNNSSAVTNQYSNSILNNANTYGQNAVQNAMKTAEQISGYSSEYDKFMGNTNSQMGTANADILGRLRANNTSGISSSNEVASRGLAAQLAQRGLTNSGIGAKAMGDLGNQFQQQLSGANAQAYGQAVQDSDAMRNNQININSQRLQGMMGASQMAGGAVGSALDNQFNATNGAYNGAYNANIGHVNNTFGNSVSTHGLTYNANNQGLGSMFNANNQSLGSAFNANNQQQGTALSAIGSQNQQNISNLTNYAQLGRGMAGISSNYLGQAGQMYGNAASASQSALNASMGANASYNNAQNSAKGASSAGIGQLAGTLGGAYLGGPMGAAAGSSLMGGR